MSSITQRFVVPPTPAAAQVSYVHPWENIDFFVMCERLYTLARQTGFTGTFDDFKKGFGAYLEANNIITKEDFETYMGQYEVTPLPLLEQILQTKDKVLEENIIIQPIPYHQTTNMSGGYTITIG